LREGVKFHDGTELDADAVVFSFERLIQEQHPQAYDPARPYQSSFKMIREVVAKDSRTVEFRLSQPSAVFLNNMAMFPASIVSPTAVKQKGKAFATSPVGSGPFKFDRWKRDQQLVVAANPDYWGGRPKLDRVIFVPIADSNSRVQQLKQAAIHGGQPGHCAAGAGRIQRRLSHYADGKAATRHVVGAAGHCPRSGQIGPVFARLRRASKAGGEHGSAHDVGPP
jgi:ABC-type transport system substrate-binding protein